MRNIENLIDKCEDHLGKIRGLDGHFECVLVLSHCISAFRSWPYLYKEPLSSPFSEVKIFNQALTGEEIKAIFNSFNSRSKTMVNSDWVPGVIVRARTYTDGERIGEFEMADFEENIVRLNCGDGFFWEGTSQEFASKWEEI